MSDIHFGEPGHLFTNERDAPPLHMQPTMVAHSWRMLKSLPGTLHLVTLRDRDADRGVVRLTSAVVSIDLRAKRVTTSSGRRYSLLVPPERAALAQQVLWAGAA